jgi:hypothetical protein
MAAGLAFGCGMLEADRIGPAIRQLARLLVAYLMNHWPVTALARPRRE